MASFCDAMALTLRQRESVIGINTMLTLPLTFLSAAFLPLALAPEWIATVARFNPVNWAVEAGREALAVTPDWSFVMPRIARARDPRRARDGVGDANVPVVPAIHLSVNGTSAVEELPTGLVVHVMHVPRRHPGRHRLRVANAPARGGSSATSRG